MKNFLVALVLAKMAFVSSQPRGAQPAGSGVQMRRLRQLEEKMGGEMGGMGMNEDDDEEVEEILEALGA